MKRKSFIVLYRHNESDYWRVCSEILTITDAIHLQNTLAGYDMETQKVKIEWNQ